MINIKVDVTSISAKVKQLESEVRKRMVDELNKFGLDTVGQAQRLTPVDEGALRRSISFSPANQQNLKVTVSASINYAAYIEFGTKKFAAAYVSSLPNEWQQYAATFKGSAGGSMNDFVQNIMAWVQRKGIGATKTKSGNNSTSASSLDAQQQAAYGIALYILRNGIKPHPFLYPSVQTQAKLLRERLKK